MSCITKIRSLRGAGCNSDHFLVRIAYRHNLKANKKRYISNKNTRKYSIENLKVEEKSAK